MMTVWPNSSTARRRRASTSPEDFESRLPVGSSAKTTAGLLASARATATRCCWPPESSGGRGARRGRGRRVGGGGAGAEGVEEFAEPLRVRPLAGDRQRQHDVLARVEDRQEVE